MLHKLVGKDMDEDWSSGATDKCYIWASYLLFWCMKYNQMLG